MKGTEAQASEKEMLLYPFQSYEVPLLDEKQGLQVAEKRCAGWGYAGAEPFDEVKKHYSDYIRVRCARWYQCTQPMPVSDSLDK
ncbi:MAG: YecR family lipoprotein [Pseudomonadota bacterium]